MVLARRAGAEPRRLTQAPDEVARGVQERVTAIGPTAGGGVDGARNFRRRRAASTTVAAATSAETAENRRKNHMPVTRTRTIPTSRGTQAITSIIRCLPSGGSSSTATGGGGQLP
ncbi:hypothetical protein BCY76_002620 [Nesterenkonia sp. PF2B19]|nr:hypothetical protein BCY76_002620 [Nesterenkonia sp. PF2B19]